MRCLVTLVLMLSAASAGAQVDPEKRRLIHVGADYPLSRAGPLGAYAFAYYNQPGHLGKDTSLRVAIAPVFADVELNRRRAFGLANTDVGFGASGGGFGQSHSEYRGGSYLRGESFLGHGAALSASVYQRLNPGRRIPLNLVARGLASYSTYDRGGSTEERFSLPPSHGTFALRAGLRFGGREPLMISRRALELSIWHEGRVRTHARGYGLADDRRLERATQLWWARALLAYTLPETRRHFEAGAVLGRSIRADRLNAFRLGAMLPLGAEFPLSLPGYFNQELSARGFSLINGRFAEPLDREARWSVELTAAAAALDPLPGFRDSGRFHSGAGGGVSAASPSGIYQVTASYGYGFQARKNGRNGAHSAGLYLQIDLEAWKKERRTRTGAQPPRPPTLEWFFRRAPFKSGG